jgi:hypothetical protein
VEVSHIENLTFAAQAGPHAVDLSPPAVIVEMNHRELDQMPVAVGVNDHRDHARQGASSKHPGMPGGPASQGNSLGVSWLAHDSSVCRNCAPIVQRSIVLSACRLMQDLYVERVSIRVDLLPVHVMR